MLGPIYCKKPSFIIDILIAAELNHTRGMIVTSPAQMSKKELVFEEKSKAF